MRRVEVSKRSGVLLCGVLPPSGVPLPQQSVKVATWMGSPAEFRQPSTQKALRSLSSIRRELAAGRTLEAARQAYQTRAEELPQGQAIRQTISTLQGVAAAHVQEVPADSREEVLKQSLELMGSEIPPALLERIFASDSLLPPDVAERHCLSHDSSQETLIRVRLLRIRQASQRLQLSGHQDADLRKEVLEQCQKASELQMNRSLGQWVSRMELFVQEERDLSALVDSLLHNMSLANSENDKLHSALRECFNGGMYSNRADAQRTQVRLSFSAWTTLRAATSGRESPELVSFSAQATALRLVFENLLNHALFNPFRKDVESRFNRRDLDPFKRSLGLGKYRGILFGSGPKGRPDPVGEEMRRWFDSNQSLEHLKKSSQFKLQLTELLDARLHNLAHYEEQARESAESLLEVVCRVGFGASSIWAPPKPGQGLVGLLVNGEKGKVKR